MEATMTAPSDVNVIVASLDEPERFAVLFDRHFAAIHRYLHRRVGRHLADDLAAETFIRAFERRGAYDLSRPDARPWLFGIATNLLRHHRRAERRRQFAYVRLAVDFAAHLDVEAVNDRVDAYAAAPTVALALGRLDARDREALLLLAWAELSYQEIAEALGIPTGTVRSRIHRARASLREALRARVVSMNEPEGLP